MKKFWYILLLFLTEWLLPNQLSSQNWQPLGGGIHWNDPKIMYADSLDNYLYVTGSFYEIDGVSCKGIARWDGISWDSLGGGMDALDTLNLTPNNTIAIARYEGELYVGGFFRSAGTVWAHRLAKWNGSSWSAHPLPPFSPTQMGGVGVLQVINSELYVGGNFDSVETQQCRGLAKWNGTDWFCFNPPLEDNYTISSVCNYNGELYIGGNFGGVEFVPNDSLQEIAKWDGNNWRSVGGGLKGLACSIGSMVVYQGELYVAGYILQSSGNAGNHIQKWDGYQWTDVGGGLNNYVRSLNVYNGKLYAVGAFTIAGGVPAFHIAIWDGVNWYGLGSTFNVPVIGSEFYNDTLHLTGGFTVIDGDSIWKIAKWTAGNYVEQCGNTTSLDNSLNEAQWEVYPNPTSGIVTVQINNPALHGEVSYRLINSMGESLLTGTMNEENFVVDLTDYPPGLYFLDIVAGNNRVCKKLLKLN